ncbi:tannase/feruloyl esterase family alpha/beta hydrolase [Amycolatopsis anabasis]|uniref:tannase/feruloyl esterase family alpha/beta hydrolase n=1 Tax=Amycolatopsis anabasis TaxID=1840409 RepID=UPI00131C033A|nr:tannase/feruloyl esterase family alpha/beta hydrolase [Amycolatopsis anabasis]
MRRGSSWRARTCVALIALTTALTGLVPSTAAAEADPVLKPVRQCAELVGQFDIPSAATRVTAATVVPATGGEPEYCDVRGQVEPAVGFQLKLPTATFTGRYLQYGCGAFCGLIFPVQFPDCGGPRGGDLAVAATDDGHVGDGIDGKWAADNQAARDDFFFRAPHVVSVAAKRIIAAYYGSPPKHSYFDGCSTGGREGLLLAQRYPDDFDGILAGAPASYFGPLAGVYATWNIRSNTGENGAPIITREKLPVLHNAAVAACDRLDGLVDGQIEDPRACRFDPVAVRCPGATDQPDCLTAAQVEAARKLYAGPADAHGRRLYPGSQPFGSELAWEGTILPSPDFPVPLHTGIADNYLKYIGYPIGTPHSSLKDFQFTVREFDRLTPEGLKANALSLDLEPFRRSGGKLILWHGWADPGIPPAATLDYYQRLVRHSGGLRQTQEFARTFMVPSLYHCAGGDRLTEFNPFRELIGWVERGKAPDKIVATGRDAQGNELRTRPVFPYPLRPQYDGTGSIDDANNFVPAPPPTPPRDAVNWVGTDLYYRPGPVAPPVS